VHHYLVSLTRNGIVAQNARVITTWAVLAAAWPLGAEPSRYDRTEYEAITAFRDETGEAAFVAVWGNRGPTSSANVEGSHPVTVEVRAGLVLAAG